MVRRFNTRKYNEILPNKVHKHKPHHRSIDTTAFERYEKRIADSKTMVEPLMIFRLAEKNKSISYEQLEELQQLMCDKRKSLGRMT